MRGLLLGATIVMAVLLACLLWINWSEANRIENAIELVQDSVIPSARLVGRMAMSVEHEEALIGEHIFERDVSAMDVIARQIAATRQDYSDAAREFSPLTTFRGEAYTWHLLTADVASLQSQENSALALSRANRDAEATQLMSATKPLFDRIDHETAELVRINRHAVDVAVRDALGRQHTASAVQLGFVAAMFMILFVLHISVTRIVVRVHRDLDAANGELANRNRELENRNRELDAFAGRIAHDLRSPLNAVSLSSELLAVNTSEGKTIGATIRRAVSQIARMIDDLLLLSRVGVMPRTVVKPQMLTPVLREDLGRLVGEAHGELSVDLEPADVQCSENLLRQVLWNLGENAVKYRRPDVPPEIHVAGHAEAERYVITVADNGVGMSADDARHAFEPFFRSPKTSSIGGTGLGLAIVRRIVEASEGRISVDSKPGEGTTFLVTLPLADGYAPTRPDTVIGPSTRPG
jgi:signal transduction histidine kinase